MLKPIKGSWFEFQHHHIPEGKYWNPICRHFSEEQWRVKIREMSSLGMEYIVLLCSSLVYQDYAESYFDSGIYPFAKDFVCQNPIEVILDEADKLNMKIFMSVGYYGFWEHAYDNMINPEVTKRAFVAMEKLYKQFGHYKSFYGWYYPDEVCIDKYFNSDFIEYVNKYSTFGRSFNKDLKSLIAPYGTNILIADDKYVSQLEIIDADFIAYQDEIGVRKAKPEQTEAYFAALKKAHDKAGRAKLWADMEVFEFEGDVYRSALIPATMERIERQLKSISPYVETVLCYEYLGMFNKPGTIAYCGHPDSVKLYRDYIEFLKKIKG
ncbi:MAG: hypothetical protein A2Y15_05005 [Clostridiales bacterium GWF2_36_10]|nr:MAG: hypothetical protein A2Y15_05005 [Clostridiales bacterium GWF2_36_10]HAN21086.1 DUF4434 domain-containing protein [Clostridiales bacterium]